MSNIYVTKGELAPKTVCDTGEILSCPISDSSEILPSRQFPLTYEQLIALKIPPCVDGVAPTDEQIRAGHLIRVLRGGVTDIT